MKHKNTSLVDAKQGFLVDLSITDIALFKETKEIAEVIKLVHGKTVNLKELYNEMWFFDKETEWGS